MLTHARARRYFTVRSFLLSLLLKVLASLLQMELVTPASSKRQARWVEGSQVHRGSGNLTRSRVLDSQVSRPTTMTGVEGTS